MFQVIELMVELTKRKVPQAAGRIFGLVDRLVAAAVQPRCWFFVPRCSLI